jgi:hypothetical protein
MSFGFCECKDILNLNWKLLKRDFKIHDPNKLKNSGMEAVCISGYIQR